MSSLNLRFFSTFLFPKILVLKLLGRQFLINIFLEFCSRAVICLFVWEPDGLLMSWHVSRLPKWSRGGARKILVKSFVVVQKILIIKRGCIMEQINFFKRLKGAFWRN